MIVGEPPGDQEDLAGTALRRPGGAGCSIAQSQSAPGSTGRARFTSPTRSSTSSTCRGASGGCTSCRPPGEVKHYRWWLKTEIDLVGPRVVVALGATALLALSGKALPLMANRGETRFDNRRGYVTVHPSYLLRLPDAATQAEAYAGFRDDLARVRALAALSYGL